MTERQATEDLRSCLRSLLAGQHWSQASPGPADLGLFFEAVARHRCAAFLHGRRHLLDARLLPELQRLHDTDRRAHLIQALDMHRVLDLLAAAGVDALAVKGPCLAVQTVGDAHGRAPGDVDLFIDPSAVPAAYAALVRDGFVPPAGAPRPGPSWAWRHLLDSYFELPFTSATGEIDLHWRLDPTVRAMPPFTAAWATRVSVVVAGRPVPTLDPALALRYACVNAARDDWRWLRALVDIHLLAARDDVWEVRDGTPLGRPQRQSLAVTRAMVGLPAGVPAAVSGAAPDQPRAVARARLWQDRPHPWQPFNRVPGAEWPNQVRRSVLGATDARDVLRVLSGVALHPLSLGDVEAPTFARALPEAVVARVRHAAGVTRAGRV